MLYTNTVNDELKNALHTLMESKEFSSFRLVGGTALSLQLGHRVSVDIDLFSDVPYGSINFEEIDNFIEKSFPYKEHISNISPAFGKSYSIGSDRNRAIKLDVFYTDVFIQPPIIVDGIRMATVEEIIAMKMDIVQRGGRKKDFWDLHELLPQYNLSSMLALHELRYPFTHDALLIQNNLIHFEMADEDFDPICLRGKHWEFIKEDISKWSGL